MRAWVVMPRDDPTTLTELAEAVHAFVAETGPELLEGKRGEPVIKVGIRYANTSREHLQRVRQLGVEGGTLRWDKLPGVAETGRPDAQAFRALMWRFGEFGIALGGMEVSRPLITGVLRGEPDRAATELANLGEAIRLIGDNGIDLLTCGFAVAHADEGQVDWRGYTDEPAGRAGAVLRTFDADRLTDDDLVAWGAPQAGGLPVLVSEQEVWNRLDTFMNAILPVARSAGVRIGFHPNDPPLPLYRGVEQPFTNPAGLDRLLGRYDEPGVGLLFCLGTIYESRADLGMAIRQFGERGKLFCVHFRNVRGTIPRFEEVFQDEGDFDSAAQMRVLHEVGYDGYVMPDHHPGVLGDTADNDMSRAWCVGYLRALIQATA